MITSKNVVFEAHFKFSFSLWKSHAPFLRYVIFYVLNYFINFESCDVMMSISKRVRIHFCIDLLNRTSFGPETWPANRYNNVFP